MHFDFKAYDFADTGSARDAIAVVDARGVLRWDALQAAVQAWEQTALNAGAVAGVPIVISGHKETAFLVAMLGCLRLRVPFVPVDVINPPERIKRIGELVRAGLRYDAQAQAFEPGSASPPLREAGLAYIMFTSGSTGDPKGVQIGRESVTLFAGWIRDCLSLGAAPAFMDQMLFSFDFSLFNWVGALELGGACVLCPRETIAERGAFMQYLADTGIAVWASTPSFVRQQLFNPDFNGASLPGLRVFVFGAESLSPALAEELWQRFPDARIINSYGPTEATCSTTWVEIDARCARPRRILPHRPRQALCRRLHRPGRDLHRRRPCHARLPEPAGPERLAHVHARRQARLPQRRPGRDRRPGPDHVPWPHRRPDQAARLSHRTGRDRRGDRGAARRARRRRVALRRPDGAIVRLIGFVEPATPGAAGLQPLPEALAAWKDTLGRRLPPYMIPSELLSCSPFPTTSTDKADRKQLERLYLDARLSKKPEPKA